MAIEIKLIEWALMLLLGASTWLLKKFVEKLEKELEQVKAENKSLSAQVGSIRENYTHKDTFKELKEEIKEYLDEIKRDIKYLMNREYK